MNVKIASNLNNFTRVLANAYPVVQVANGRLSFPDEMNIPQRCYVLVIQSQEHKRALQCLYRHAPHWLYRQAKKGTFPIPMTWTDEVREVA